MRKIALSKGTALILVLTVFLILTAGSGFADNYSYNVKRTVVFDRSTFEFDKVNTYDLIRSDGSEYLNEIGKPMLPIKTVRLALPEGMKAENLNIVNVSYEPLADNINIFPAQKPIKIGFSTDDLKMIEPDPDIYNTDIAYPANPARLVSQADLAGQSFANVEIFPIRYIPSEKRVEIISSIEFEIEGNGGYEYGDYLPNNISTAAEEEYQKRLSLMVDNDEAINMTRSFSAAKDGEHLPDGGPYDYLTITSTYLASSFDPLVEWHTRKGLHDTVITTDYIYANYSGSDNQEKIRNFIIDAHQSWGTVYFLMGGEHSIVPFEYRTYEGENIPSDVYYADYDDDWTYEVYVGRVSAETLTEVGRFVGKVIEYETDPVALNYPTDITLLGMDLTLATQAPYYTLTRSEYLKDSIDAGFIPSNMLVTTVYDTDAGNHRDNFLAAINDGQNLINHSDHSNATLMGTGDLNHGLYINNYNIPYLTNYHKYCNIVSLGCLPNRMDYSDCIAEHFIFDNDTTGGVSFTGNTRSGWFYVGDPFSLSSALDLQWWVGFFDHDMYHLGDALAYCKSAVNIEQIFPYSEWTFNLLGDPGMAVWTDHPLPLTAVHDSVASVAAQNYEVTVTMINGTPIEGATVTIWKRDDFYMTGTTDSDGLVSFYIDPATKGDMMVTASMRNYVPYLGDASISGNEPPQCINPGDTTIFLCGSEQVSIPVGCLDGDNNLLSGPTKTSGPGEIIDNAWIYTPTVEETVEIGFECLDSLGAGSETTFFVTFEFNDMPLLTCPGDTAIDKLEPAEEITLPYSMVDDNMSSCVITSGPGTLDGSLWRYTPAGDEEFDVTIELTDECGATDTKTFHLDYNLYICGDANGDGEVNILDVTYMIDFVYNEGSAPDPLKSGDVNGDDTRNIIDITYLIAFLYRSGPAPNCS